MDQQHTDRLLVSVQLLWRGLRGGLLQAGAELLGAVVDVWLRVQEV